MYLQVFVSSGMKLYFTADGKIDPEYSVLFNQIGVKIRGLFIDFINFISWKHGKSISWWVSSPASRNTYASPLFHYCCCLILLRELILRKEPIAEIITDSRAFKKIIEDYLVVKNINISVSLDKVPIKVRLQQIVLPIYVLFGLPLKHFLLFFMARQILSLNKSLPLEPLTLIDTFVMPGYIEQDRYYPGILDALSAQEKSRVWFVPHLFGIRWWQYLKVIKRLHRSERNFLLKDNFLKLKDYWCLWQHFFDVRKLKIKYCSFCDVDISTLIREELIGFWNIASSYEPLLSHRFAKRLKEADVSLKLVIDWFENQVIDKGWNAGFNQFNPHTKTIGYQGFVPINFELNIYPTPSEKANMVLPMEIGVIGKSLFHTINKYCPDVKLRLLPAIRYKGVWKNRKYYPEEDIFTILVALPMLRNESDYMLELLIPIAEKMSEKTRFLLKFHPATSLSQIKSTFRSVMLDRFEVVNGEFNDCVEKSSLLISSASSVCLETLAKGIPVIIVGSGYCLTQNPIPETITEDIWSLCYTHDEIASALQFYKGRSQETIKEHEATGRRIREEYFEPVTPGALRSFLGFNK